MREKEERTVEEEKEEEEMWEREWIQRQQMKSLWGREITVHGTLHSLHFKGNRAHVLRDNQYIGLSLC